MHIDKSFVLTWAELYEQHMGSTEPRLLDEVGPTAAARGHYEPEELTAVARWKTPRSGPGIAANSGSDIRQITAIAFAAPEPLRHRALTLLSGVGVPTATALLAVAFPDRHTIIDVRSTESLRRLEEWDGQRRVPGLSRCLQEPCHPSGSGVAHAGPRVVAVEQERLPVALTGSRMQRRWPRPPRLIASPVILRR